MEFMQHTIIYLFRYSSVWVVGLVYEGGSVGGHMPCTIHHTVCLCRVIQRHDMRWYRIVWDGACVVPGQGTHLQARSVSFYDDAVHAMWCIICKQQNLELFTRANEPTHLKLTRTLCKAFFFFLTDYFFFFF
jgi:hypothetical protein